MGVEKEKRGFMFDTELNNIILADCMDIMKDIPDKYFELAIVDPPYGIGDFNQTKSKKFHKKIEWNNEIPTEEYFKELYRISKNRIIWGANYYGKYIIETGRIIHDKCSANSPQLKELSDADIASHSFGVNIKMFRYIWRGNVQGDSINWKNTGIDARCHPCQKPVALYRWLLQNYAKPGDKIIDTHSGSGSLACACHLEKFDFLAIEKDDDYFKSSVERLDTLRSQGTLF